MKLKAVSGIMLTLLLIGMSTLAFNIQPAKAEPTTWTVDDDGPADFHIIQKAINAANPGDTVYVYNGTYYEHVVVNKSVTVVGENKITTIIDGSRTGIVVYVTADNVYITGFTIKNSSHAYLGSCISLQNSRNTTITDNMISYGDSCIRLNYSRGNKILNNAITNPDHYGIYLRFSSENNIAGNNISHVSYGIELHSSENNTINNNIIERVNWSSINIIFSSGNALRNNKMMDNYVSGKYFGVWGVSLEHYIQDIDTSNTIDGEPIFYLVNQEDMQIPADAGYVGVVNSTNITVRDSTLGNNFQGVLFAYTDNSTIKNVTISNSEFGIRLYSCNNNTISHSRITGFCGVSLFFSNDTIFVSNNVSWTRLSNLNLYSSSNNLIAGNILSFSRYGMGAGQGLEISGGSNNIIRGNTLSENTNAGILIYGSNSNTVYNNLITNNLYGTVVSGENNSFYHNNFIDNANNFEVSPDNPNVLDNGIEGNYWSNYTGVDLNHDGIGDTSHVIDANNTDRYPLMGMFHSFNTSVGEYVNVVSNSTIESFQHFESNSTIIIHVSNMTASQTHGFCRVSIPYEVMSEPFSVTIDGANPTYWNYTLYDNGTNRWIYFEYEHSTREIVIVPEFPSFAILPLFMIITLLAVMLYRRKRIT